MTKIKNINILLILIVLISLCSCNNVDRTTTVSDLAYNNSSKVNTVYVKEQDEYIPFIVLTDDYYGNTLLVRKDVMDEPKRVNDYSSFYENSEIDIYLNNEYLMHLEDISSHIISTDLEITSKSSLGTTGGDIKTIQRKVFLLSCNEIGINEPVNMAIEGVELKYFKDENNRKAYVDNKPSSWWLRTPNTYDFSCVYVVGDNNKIGFTNAYDQNGIRPAFCVKGDMRLELKSNIVDGQNVYIFSLEN